MRGVPVNVLPLPGLGMVSFAPRFAGRSQRWPWHEYWDTARARTLKRSLRPTVAVASPPGPAARRSPEPRALSVCPRGAARGWPERA